jgi:hypothetical protein
MARDPILGIKLSITGTVEEHLLLPSKSQEWVSLRLENGILITINLKYCIPITEKNDDNANGTSGKQGKGDSGG